MKRIFIALIITLFTVPALAQSNDYKEMAKEVDQEIWNDKDPAFAVNKLPAEFKNESAVILARKQTVETNTERKGRSLLYIGKMHSKIKRTIRERIFINDQVSLDEYSQINFNKLQSKQSGALTKLINYTFMGIQVTKANGSVQKINVDEAAVKLDETRDASKNKIAVPDLVIGDIIDYYITYFEQARTDKDVDYLTFVFGDEYPILNLSIKILFDKRVAAQYQAINGAPDFKITNVEDDKLLELSATNLLKSTNVIWTSESRQIPIIRVKYAFADIVHGRGDYTKAGNIERVTAPDDVEHAFINLIKPYLVQLTVDDVVRTEWRKYAKERNIDKDNLDSILHFVYYYFRHYSFGMPGSEYLSGNATEYYSDCSGELSKLKQLEKILKVMKCLNSYFDADAELVLGSDRNNVAYKDIFSIGDLNFMLRVTPKGSSEPVFYYLGSNMYNFKEIPASFENETYKFIQQNSIFRRGGDMSQEKADKINGKAVAFKTSAADNNQTEELTIDLDKTDMQVLNIKRKSTARGYQRKSMQNSTLILEDYWIAEQRLLNKEQDIKTAWPRGLRKQWPDVEQAMSKAKTGQKEKLEKEIAAQYEDKPKELKSYTILQDGFAGPNGTIALEEEFSMDGWVKKAGNNYIIEAGKFVGGQLEIKADQRERKLDIYMPCSRSFNYNITFKIPEGYSVEGIEKLNKSVKNECGGFESAAKIDGDRLLIRYVKYYSNSVEPAANWSKILAFVDAAFAFTKEKLLLKKK
jgi:hypothetical protein